MNRMYITWSQLRSAMRLATRRVPMLTGIVALAGWLSAPASASTAFGDLNNFDVFNDTGQECHGFEIELDDIHSTDITYTFDWNHYGAPTITEDSADPLHPKVFVRYAAKYASPGFSAFTAVPAAPPSPTNGHMCTDPSVNIGCEHFGVGYYGAPTAVKYNWLVEDPFAPGSLMHGPAVNVATPTWTYIPPVAAQPAQVQAVIQAPPPPPAPVYEFGDATWVKSIKTTTHNNGRVELKDLVSDDPDDPNDKNWTNGEPDEVEVEWQILQTEFSNANGANNELAGGDEGLPNGDEVVTRRYEFYKYEGPFDPETHEIKCEKYPPVADPDQPGYKAECDPAVVNILGDYIGAQMAGFDVEAALGLIDHIQEGELDQPFTPRTVVVGGNTPYTTEITAGAVPAGMTLDSTTGVLSGTPSASGEFRFTIKATDADAVQATKSYIMTVVGPQDPCAGVVCVPLDACHVAGTCDPSTGNCSNPAANDGTPCNDGDLCTQNETCQAGTCSAGAAVTCSASDQCHVAGTCDPSTGNCSNPAANDGTPCNDGDLCTLTDTCQGGACTGVGPSPECGLADLSLKAHAAKRKKLGKIIKYKLRTKNRGPAAAAAAVATLTCAGAPFHVVAIPTDCVDSGGVFTCSVGTLPPRKSASRRIFVAADGTGTLTCAASASSTTWDPDSTNQVATMTTEVF